MSESQRCAAIVLLATCKKGSTMRRPDDVMDESGLASYLFVDRVPDSKALTDSLRAHLDRVRADTIDSTCNENVLTFYGLGGMGKTRLSQRMEHWLQGELGDATEWGPRPIETTATVRWDLDHGDGNLDLVAMILALRVGLGRISVRTPAFDLALAAYLAGVRPGETVELLSGPDTKSFLDVLGSLAADFGASNLAASLGTSAIHKVVDIAIGAYNRHRELSHFPRLGGLLERCRAIPAGDPSADVVIDLAWLLTEEIDALPPAKRPALVIFVDTVEKVQQPSAIKCEVVLSRLMLHLPYALFVVTGREKLTWHELSDSPKRGPRWWPSLVEGRTSEPRQHLLGRLSDVDRDALIERRRRSGGWPISNEQLAIAARRTGGFPLHVDAVCRVADNLTENGAAVITADDIGTNLPDLVRRLIAGLSDEQARAFQAACLLPFFDTALVAAVGGICEGAVEQCVRRTLVEPHQSKVYPYKVHDEIRVLVRRAGTQVHAGWNDADWQAAALRGLEEAKRRFNTAWDANDDMAIIEALVLSITIAVAHNVHADWLVDAVRFAPTMRGLAGMVPWVPAAPASSDAVALVQLIKAMDAPKAPEAEATMRALFAGPTAVAEPGGRWLAYRLRAHHRRDEALDVFEQLLQRFPERTRLYRNQYSITLQQLRRFADMVAYREEHGLAPIVTRVLNTCHGMDVNCLTSRLERAKNERSRRYGFEVETSAWSVEARFRPVPRRVVDDFAERAIILGAPAREADAWIVRAYATLHDEDGFERALAELERIGRVQSEFPRASITRLLAMRALVSGLATDADRAWRASQGKEFARPSGWIFTEFALELIDRPLPEVRTQWLEPVEVVRERWYAIIHDIIARSAEGRILVEA